jgi:hypothetical protein
VTNDIKAAGLTIDAGVNIVFAGHFAFEVTGVLRAMGTQTEPISFTGNTAATTWQGIFFNQSPDGCELLFCLVEQSSLGGIRIHNSKPKLDNCTIRNNTVAGYQARGAGVTSDVTLALTSCVISSNSVSASGTSDYTHFAAGAGIYCAQDVVLMGCRIEHNTATLSHGGWTPVAYGAGVFSLGTVFAYDTTISDNRCNADVAGGPSNAAAYGGGYLR